MKRVATRIIACVIGQLVWSGATWSADERLVADNWQTPGEIKAAKGNWQTPGEIQVPKGNWQTPGEIQVPKGNWQTPGEIQVPKGNWQVPKDLVKVKDDGCQHRLAMGSDVLFEFNEADLNPNATQELNYLGGMIQKYGKHPVLIEGHTDSKGGELYNQTLSEKRAESVKNWLVEHQFIDESATVAGFGKRKPVAANTLPNGKDNPPGRKKNRRVEIVVDTCH